MRLTVKDLALARGGRTLFSGIGLDVRSGMGVEVTGPNGAGKTSLLRALAGFLPVEQGRISLAGGDPDATLGEQCHFIGHLNGIKRALTVQENLDFWARYLGPGGDVHSALDTFGLGTLGSMPAGLLSAGQARRLALARLVACPRPVWLLDEPDASLDKSARKVLASVMRAHMKTGGIIMAATHGPLGVKFARCVRLGAKGGGR